MKKYTFVNPDPELQNNLMAFGFECGEGWFPLIIELFDKLQDMVDKNPILSDIQVLQVKEKWGSLNVYLNYYFPEVEKLVDEYEAKSLTICEKCGSTENVDMRNNHGWYNTLCERCDNEIKNAHQSKIRG